MGVPVHTDHLRDKLLLTAWQATGSTDSGTAAGFVVEPSLAVVTGQERGKALAEHTGLIRICISAHRSAPSRMTTRFTAASS
jgi:hypothetical protein